MLSVQALSTKTRRVMFLFQRAAKENSLLLHDTLTVTASCAEKDLRCANRSSIVARDVRGEQELECLDNAYVSSFGVLQLSLSSSKVCLGVHVYLCILYQSLAS